MISKRTSEALQTAKARGGFRGAKINDAARAVSVERRKVIADDRAAELAPFIVELQAAGVTSLNKIAAALTGRGISAPRGGERWTPSQVSRVLSRVRRNLPG
jgi:DNA invertase Pin-like site-specific DNA recombinase